MLDYAVLSRSMVRFVCSMTVDDEACFGAGKSHFGILTRLQLRLEKAQRWVLSMPQRFQYPPRPQTQAYPNSKRSRQRLFRQLAEAAAEPELPLPPMRARRQI
eukprot:981875-Pyramimonas_sp.AAC.1